MRAARESGAVAWLSRFGQQSRRLRFLSARLVAGALLGSVLLLSTGCVYLRLLELKLQIDRFDKFFGLQTQDGLAIICHTPVLKASDLRWMGVKPEKIQKLGQAEKWQVRMVKQLPPGVTEKVEYDILLDFTFVDERMSRVAIPEKYFAVMPKPFLVGVIKSLGRGRVDKTGKKIEATVSAEDVAAARPNLPSIDKLLGQPTDEREDGSTTIVRYRYSPATTEPKPGVYDMFLTFHTKSGELLRWQGNTPVGRIGFDFGADRAKR